MEKTPIQSGSESLRPRARLIKTIGEELISSDVVALIELVKNSYDADATIVTIEFKGRVIIVEEGKKKKKILLKQGGSIIVSDDGSGMGLDIIKAAWMEPATIMKKNTKRSPGKDGKNGRTYTGEKGIGRFASAKLASTLKMITRRNDDNEVVVNFVWSDFSNETKYLDEVECKWEVREPVEIKENGTILNLDELNTDWDEDKFRQLRVSLSRLINPISPIADFLIDIKLPSELKEYSDLISSPDLFNKPEYTIKGSIANDGKATIIYNSRNIGKDEVLQIESLQLRDPVRTAVVGPFSFEFRVWDRDTAKLKKIATEIGSTVKNVKTDLDDLAGISIYRDKFRVLPYGEPKDDWLRLDFRRVNNPTMNLSNNQIVGYVSISREDNKELKDQSNREGLVESQALTDLNSLIILILKELEIRRYKERPREATESNNQKSLFTQFSIAPISEVIQRKLPNDSEAKDIVEKTEATIQAGIKKVQEVLSRYRRLSTLGILIDVVLHDGNNFLAKIDTELHLLAKAIQKKEINKDLILEHVGNIDNERKVLAQLFKRLEPFGGRKRGRPKDVVLEDAISGVFDLYKSQLAHLNIEVKLPESKNDVRIDEGELEMIIVNLLQNSMYWLEEVDEKKIVINVERTETELSIIFSDNGPGVDEENQKLIFDPYFSTKPNGIGLGLTHVGELVSEYDGDFCLIDNGPLDGATFKITFRRRV